MRKLAVVHSDDANASGGTGAIGFARPRAFIHTFPLGERYLLPVPLLEVLGRSPSREGRSGATALTLFPFERMFCPLVEMGIGRI